MFNLIVSVIVVKGPHSAFSTCMATEHITIVVKVRVKGKSNLQTDAPLTSGAAARTDPHTPSCGVESSENVFLLD